jgi:hypothetical protein
MPFGEGSAPEFFEGVAEALAHLGRDVHVDAVHALHGVAVAVHLDNFADACVVEPG